MLGLKFLVVPLAVQRLANFESLLNQSSQFFLTQLEQEYCLVLLRDRLGSQKDGRALEVLTNFALIVFIPLLSRSILGKHFLGVTPHLGADTSSDVGCNLFPVFLKELDTFKILVEKD